MLSVPYPMSWADEARDTSAWLGNTLQNEAFRKLYSVAERVRLCDDRSSETRLVLFASQRPLLLYVYEVFVRRELCIAITALTIVRMRLLPIT